MLVELSTFFGALGAAGGKSATGEGIRLLRELVGLQTAQEELLRSVNVNLSSCAGPLRRCI
jgi:hypothetical protein